MKTFKRLLAAVMAAVIIAGVSTPIATEAATTSVTSVKVDSVGSNYCYISVGTRGSGSTEAYKYAVYVNGKIVKSGSSEVYVDKGGGSKRYCKVSIPANTACAVRVKAKRGGVWSKWSAYVGVVPQLTTYKPTTSGTTIKLKWKKMAGASDYAVYTRKAGGAWKKLKSVSASATGTTISLKSWPLYEHRDVRVIARKKVNGKYVGSWSWVYYDCYRRIKY